MGYEVRLTAKARGDLNEIVAYIAQDNPLAAERVGDELAAEADSLSTNRKLQRHPMHRRFSKGLLIVVRVIFPRPILCRKVAIPLVARTYLAQLKEPYKTPTKGIRGKTAGFSRSF